MAFLDSMKNKLASAGQSTAQKAKDFSEITKLNGMISSSENKIKDLYGRLGYEVYCAYHENPLPEVAQVIAEITQLHNTIEDCKKQITAINNANNCPKCGTKLSRGMAFCSGCGYKIPAAEVPAAAAQNAFCTQCGASVPAGSAFCIECGSKLN